MLAFFFWYANGLLVYLKRSSFPVVTCSDFWGFPCPSDYGRWQVVFYLKVANRSVKQLCKNNSVCRLDNTGKLLIISVACRIIFTLNEKDSLSSQWNVLLWRFNGLFGCFIQKMPLLLQVMLCKIGLVYFNAFRLFKHNI